MRTARSADLKDFFNEFGVSSQVGSESPLLGAVNPWLDAFVDDVQSNELRRYERQAREAAEKASTLLRGEFIKALTARIGKMQRDLLSMNRSLQDHPFHNERYAFHRAAVAEFQPILKVIEISKTASEALDMLFVATCRRISRTGTRWPSSRRCSKTPKWIFRGSRTTGIFAILRLTCRTR